MLWKNQLTWYLNQDGPWVNKPSGKGPRWIIVHAITKDGWVDGAELVFEAKKRTGDYHGPIAMEKKRRSFYKPIKNRRLVIVTVKKLYR